VELQEWIVSRPCVLHVANNCTEAQ